MGHIIQTVANLTDHRDRDALVDNLLSLFQGLIGASRLTLWRVVRRDESFWVRRRAEFASAGAPADEDFLSAVGNMLFPLRMRDCLHACFVSRQALLRPMGEGGGVCQVFPVMDGHEIVDLLEIVRPTPLSPEQEQMVTGMLRIYRNHHGLLDYGDCDELTGLRNRRTFHDTFSKLANCPVCSEKVEDGRPCLRHPHLAVIDIDYFKRINDHFGHPFGDEVLVLFAGLMRECFADPERSFRFGGEEFLLIVEDASAQEAFDLLEGFRKKVETFRFPQVGPVTISIGYTRVRAGDTGASAFGRADAALYVAKQNGRNQVRCHEMLVTDGVIECKMVVGQDVELF